MDFAALYARLLRMLARRLRRWADSVLGPDGIEAEADRESAIKAEQAAATDGAAPSEAAMDASEDLPHADAGDGPPAHWLAMLERRAPHLLTTFGRATRAQDRGSEATPRGSAPAPKGAISAPKVGRRAAKSTDSAPEIAAPSSNTTVVAPQPTVPPPQRSKQTSRLAASAPQCTEAPGQLTAAPGQLTGLAPRLAELAPQLTELSPHLTEWAPRLAVPAPVPARLAPMGSPPALVRSVPIARNHEPTPIKTERRAEPGAPGQERPSAPTLSHTDTGARAREIEPPPTQPGTSDARDQEGSSEAAPIAARATAKRTRAPSTMSATLPRTEPRAPTGDALSLDHGTQARPIEPPFAPFYASGARREEPSFDPWAELPPLSSSAEPFDPLASRLEASRRALLDREQDGNLMPERP